MANENTQNDRTLHSNYYLPKVEIKDYSVVVGGKNFFDQPINIELTTYENTKKIATGKWDDYTTSCFLDYSYFKEKYKVTVIDLRKQQALDVDSRVIQQINFAANLDRTRTTTMFFIIKEAKETVLMQLRWIIWFLSV